MPTMTEPLQLECGYPIEPVQRGAARRCMVTLAQHRYGPETLDHAYVSLMVPCLHCPAAIAWAAGDWRDSQGGADHVPDPRYL